MNQTLSLPHRFSEKSFRRYESIIAKAVNAFPLAVKINPSDLGLAAETVRGRLRDALTSYKEHRWSSVRFEFHAFAQIHDRLVVALEPDGTVIIGTKDSIKSPRTEEAFIPVENDILDLSVFSSCSCEEILSFLAHSGALRKQIKLNINQQTANILLTKYDIVLTPLSDNSFLLQ